MDFAKVGSQRLKVLEIPCNIFGKVFDRKRGVFLINGLVVLSVDGSNVLLTPPKNATPDSFKWDPFWLIEIHEEACLKSSTAVAQIHLLNEKIRDLGGSVNLKTIDEQRQDFHRTIEFEKKRGIHTNRKKLVFTSKTSTAYTMEPWGRQTFDPIHEGEDLYVVEVYHLLKEKQKAYERKKKYTEKLKDIVAKAKDPKFGWRPLELPLGRKTVTSLHVDIETIRMTLHSYASSFVASLCKAGFDARVETYGSFPIPTSNLFVKPSLMYLAMDYFLALISTQEDLEKTSRREDLYEEDLILIENLRKLKEGKGPFAPFSFSQEIDEPHREKLFLTLTKINRRRGIFTEAKIRFFFYEDTKSASYFVEFVKMIEKFHSDMKTYESLFPSEKMPNGWL